MSRATSKVVTDLLERLAAQAAAGAHLRLDSRDVQPGDIFVAVPGGSTDGRGFVAQAVVAQASAVLYEARGAVEIVQGDVLMLPVAGLRDVLGELGHAWYGRPSEAMTVMAVTGTNGKTSCVQWLAEALNAQGVRCGRIGTLGVALPGAFNLSGALTTPDVLTLHRVLAQLRDAGAQAVALEASSIGIEQGRLDGLHIAIAAYTNLTRDHLDYHGDMAAYEAAKRSLFKWPDLRAAIINLDDEAGRRILADARVRNRVGFSCKAQTERNDARVRAVDIHHRTQGLSFTLVTPEGKATVTPRLIGQHNVENLLLVASVLRALHWSLPQIVTALSVVKPVDGRLEIVATPADDASVALPKVVVDYAHTPDSLDRALAALRPLAEARGGRLVCLFGCGGERDTGKRPEMGRIAAERADHVVLSSDNPRGEAPHTIIDQILQGVPSHLQDRVQVVPERAQAILRTIWNAHAADVVLLAGKGHETYQDIAGRRWPFDDREWARAALVLLPAPSVSTDSRSIAAGDVFVALVGEHFDGHDYLDRAHAAGARAALVARRVQSAALTQIVLGETRWVLGQLASAWRSLHTLPLIAVTGSNGKTTTKEMIATILAAWLGEAARLASPGNFNNDIGVPLTLLRLRAHHRAAVVELGMNHPGEIAGLASMAAPTIAVVINAQREHQEFMHTVQAVARENGSVLTALPSDGVAVYPAADDYTDLWDALSGARERCRFSAAGDGVRSGNIYVSDVTDTADAIRCRVHTPQGEAWLSLALPGRHNLHNALAALGCGLAAGASLQVATDALGGFAAVKGRMQRVAMADASIVIDDTYNADPDSVRAAIDVLARLPAPRALVLGDMGEIGNEGAAMHREVGEYARSRGIDMLYTLGDACTASREGYGVGARGFDSPAEMVEALWVTRPASVLVKGSRFMRMERVVMAYRERIEHAVKGGSHAA